MIALIADPLPLQTDSDGVCRVAGTRVTLDTIVAAYNDGATPEEIHLRYESVPLADIHAVIAYYLRHHEAVVKYLTGRAVAAGIVREQVASKQGLQSIRERLIARTAR